MTQATRTLLCYGDSNTHGSLPMPDLETSGRMARGQRWTTLMPADLPGWEVIAEGHPGRTVVHDDPVEGEHRNGLTILPAILESHRPIDLVLVMLGTNDLKPRFSVGPVDIAQSLGRMVQAIRGSACGPGGGAPGVLLVAPPPILEQGCLAEIFEGGAAKSASLGREIGKVAARLGVAFFDAGQVVAVSPVDGIHYDPADMPALASALAGAVRAACPD